MRGLILAAIAAVFSVVTQAFGSEDGLSRGFMQSRVLGADAIHWLRTAAVAAGREDRAGKYPAGAMAVVVLPVARLDFDAMMAVLPLVCEVTIDGDPARWEAYSEVRILNRHAYAGYAYGERFGGLRDACDGLRSGERARAAPHRSLMGEWDAQIPWKFATPVDVIGYGGYRGGSLKSE